jgi:hypothetical protein
VVRCLGGTVFAGAEDEVGRRGIPGFDAGEPAESTGFLSGLEASLVGHYPLQRDDVTVRASSTREQPAVEVETDYEIGLTEIGQPVFESDVEREAGEVEGRVYPFRSKCFDGVPRRLESMTKTGDGYGRTATQRTVAKPGVEKDYAQRSEGPGGQGSYRVRGGRFGPPGRSRSR